jgi:hypothetical protein
MRETFSPLMSAAPNVVHPATNSVLYAVTTYIFIRRRKEQSRK